MMIGGPDAIVKHLDPVFDTLAPGLGDIPRTPDRGERDTRAPSVDISTRVRPGRGISSRWSTTASNTA